MRDAIATPESIYGTILFLAMLSAATVEQTSQDLFFHGIVASVSIWSAHVIAVVVSTHGSRNNREVGIRESFRKALDHSYGILIGPLVPTLVLLLGTFNLVDDYHSYAAAILSSVVILGALGYLAMSERKARWYICLISAFVTAAVGVGAAGLKGIFS